MHTQKSYSTENIVDQIYNSFKMKCPGKKITELDANSPMA